MTFVCQRIFQFGQQSLSKEDNVTAICNKDGMWEFISDNNMCADQSGATESLLYSPLTLYTPI